jgi:salicylate hydroxylase
MLTIDRFGDVISHVETTTSSAWGRSCVHRAKFLDELSKLIPEETAEFSKCLVDIHETTTGICLSLEDGTTASASAVICSDGIRSCGRRLLLGWSDPNANAVFMGEYVYRSLIPRDIAIRTVGKETSTNGTIYCGYGGYIITYPVERGQLVNMVADRQMTGGAWEDEELVTPGTREGMLDDFDSWGRPISGLPQEVKDPNLWGIFDSPPLDSFCKSNICLIGDAAHASSPHQGAGAAVAFEDAYMLSGLLGSLGKGDNFGLAFKAFDQVGRSRAQKLVKTSRSAGLVYGFSDECIWENLEQLRMNIETRWSWIWNVDLPGEPERAKRVVRESRRMRVDGQGEMLGIGSAVNVIFRTLSAAIASHGSNFDVKGVRLKISHVQS